jgi:hypothetical protein
MSLNHARMVLIHHCQNKKVRLNVLLVLAANTVLVLVKLHQMVPVFPGFIVLAERLNLTQ